MPSPFPGMDPFLEHPDIFPDFHDAFLAYLRESLQARLPEPYVASLGRRAWIEVSERYIGPDVQVSRPASGRPAGQSPVPGSAEDAPQEPGTSGAGTAVASPPRSRPVVVHVPHDERSEPFVEVFLGRGSQRRLVACIELLSWANKTPGEHGRDLYLRKQREVLSSKVHLVEIDLLRGGEHTTAVPRDRLVRVAGEYEYHVSIHRFDNWEDYWVYPIRLNERLPEIGVPLWPGDGEVGLDLQAVMDRTYESGPYRREIDYRQDTPHPPLAPAWQAWVRAVLHPGHAGQPAPQAG